MSTTKSKVAIIGVGHIGKAVATNLINGNHPVMLASRKPDDAKALAQQLGNLATAMDIAAAINGADIIVLAVSFDSINEVLTRYATALEGKIIVDPSNPIVPDGKGGFAKKIGEKESAGEIHAALLPKGVKLVKALGTLSATSLTSTARRTPATVLFYAADDAAITDTIDAFIADTGFAPVRIGGIDQSIKLEVFGALHEYGGLGKVVTLEEAKAFA